LKRRPWAHEACGTAGTAMVTQAKQLPQGALALLR